MIDWRRALLLALVGSAAGAALGACKVKIPSSQGEASGLECEASETCPYPESPCLLAMCLDGECVHVPAPQGNLPDDEQERGDCKQRYCDGQGSVSSFPARIDLPGDDGNPCTEATCDVDVPKQRPKAAGARCGDEGLCNGAGVCGVCLPGKERCDGHAVRRCGKKGQWSEPKACTNPKPLCSAAKCIGVTQLATGRAHACAAFDDGSLRCWGANHRGQLGDGGLARAQSPGWAGLSGLAFGPRHACGVKAGAASCWGAGDFGQLGNGAYGSPQGPTTVVLGGVAEVAVGDHHSCARTTAGEVHCWGRNDRGQLGSGTRPPQALSAPPPPAPGAPRSEIQAVAEASDVADLVVAGDHSCARRATGALACWGLRPYALPATIERPEPGEDGTPPDPEAVKAYERLEKATMASPTAIAGLSDVQQIACGSNHCCARLPAGKVSCWGAGKRGQLGRSLLQDSFTPVAVEGLTGAAYISLGADFGCAQLGTGGVSCWGANDQGQLGNGAETAVGKASPIPSLGSIQSLHLGDAFACALSADGQVHCWGAGALGQLGPLGREPQRAPQSLPW
ncbi:MAG: hypothetical protein JRI68_15315 [Deltaproteobacteria bacterium]|nr:hypothetical protein [Deltaproteobacteria bacterium]